MQLRGWLRGQEPWELSRDAFCDKCLSPGGSGWAVRTLSTQLRPPPTTQSRFGEVGEGRDARIPPQPCSGNPLHAPETGDTPQNILYQHFATWCQAGCYGIFSFMSCPGYHKPQAMAAPSDQRQRQHQQTSEPVTPKNI